MYLKFFNLKMNPFTIGCDERFFFESEIHAEALANMLYTVQERKGMVMITGEVGAGKTFLSNMLATKLGPTAQVIMVAHPPDSSKQLLRAVADGLEIKLANLNDKLSLVKELEKVLERYHRREKLVAVIFDESQDMTDEAMEEIRLLWNMEREGQRLIQVVLVGQPQLRARIRQPKWEPLQQRIVMSYHLGRLSLGDTARYILHRRDIAAIDGCPLRFTPQALEYIYQVTRGIPRLINVFCDNALLTAYAKNTHKVTSTIVAEAAKNMTCWPVRSPVPVDESE